MKTIRIILLTLRLGSVLAFSLLAVFSVPVHAQSDRPLAVVLTVDAVIQQSSEDYIVRGLKAADQRGAEVVILQLNTPGGYGSNMLNIVEAIRSSRVPVVVYVTPSGGMAGSAGAIITMAGHAAAMDPGTIIGAATPISGSGSDLGETAKAKAMEAMRAEIRALTERRNPEAQQLALDMIEKAKAVTAKEAKQAELVDFLATDLNDLFRQLDGFKVEMKDGTRALDTANAQVEELPMSLIEELLTVLTDSSIVFLLGAIGLLLIWVEISSPGGWVAGFAGVVCLALSAYGLGYIPVNWFGIVFVITAFVLFLLDIKAITHGALTTAGVVSFVVGALVLFNTPSTPSFQHVPVPLVVGVGIAFGALFFGIMLLALRVRHAPVLTGEESLVGKTGTAKTSVDEAGGHVQVMSELWSAEAAEGSEKIRKGDAVEVVEVKGLRLKVKKFKVES